ncbi:MAG: aminoacyl-tRNA hydrolase [Bacilli bacterium]|nr:aminoacyl-tRNA hydrolase [Bacilli bacterium]
MKIIIGLGNPGLKYRATRHNVGFMMVDMMATYYQKKWTLSKPMKCETCELAIDGEKVILVKPLTYMNLSGQAAIAIINFYKVPLKDVLVIYDDLDLEVGCYKIKPTGSSGGQKGMKSLIDCLGTQDIQRIRIGITSVEKPDKEETIDYVLGKFSKLDKAKIDALKIASLLWAEDFVRLSFDELMNKYNRKCGL